MKKLFFLLLLVMPVSLLAQRAMTVKDVQDYKRISYKELSNDGKWIISVTEAWRGDGDRNGRVADYSGDATAKIIDAKGQVVQQFAPIASIKFSADSHYVIASIKTPEAVRDSIALAAQNSKEKGKEKAKDKTPMNKLVVYALGGNTETIDSLRNHKLAEKTAWLAYQTGKKDSTLHIRALGGNSFGIPNIESYQFSTDGEWLSLVTNANGIDGKAGLYLLKKGSQTPILVKEGKGVFKQLCFTKEGNSLAFLYAEDKKETSKGMQLYLSVQGATAQVIAETPASFAPEGWIISENGRLRFSDNGKYLSFGTAPAPKEEDKNILKSQRPNVQVWSWDETVQYTVQDYAKGREAKRTYEAVYNLELHQCLQLATAELPSVSSNATMNSPYVLLSGNEAYSRSSMWEGRSKADYYSLNIVTGEKRQLLSADYGRYRLSPEGKFAYGYNETDSIWRTINMETGEITKLTTPDTFQAWDSDNDVPDYPRAYGEGGWLPDDEYLLLYDRYDIYRISPSGGKLQRITLGGKENRIQFRLSAIGTIKDRNNVRNPKEVQVLTGWNEVTKGYGFYQLNALNKAAAPTALMAGNYMLGALTKAKDANKVLFTRETYQDFPELYLCDLSFRKPVQLTHEGEQQQEFLWGTAELVHWRSYKGVELEGVLYKPANFDPTKKYPLLVNFYETNSETLYSYHMPQPHRSTPDYHLYNSQEYIVFNPDVRYVPGHPGESCYDCVMSGIDEILKGGFVDEKCIGAAGHSWGGYQTAYLATRTNRFAALESGAPVVNMFSAYGGIRWGSGMARAFQYEHTQSRIGGTPWDAADLYTENSPLFTMDKVTTPLLIMHNDTDGHVPWYQGIEYAVALKRLNKTYWMLNYTGEPHWPVRMANRVDFQQRMLQYFDHFLKGKPMPKWMKEGIRAVDQPYELGY